jgi:D-sedoheptulose 7-phosphate isomerase
MDINNIKRALEDSAKVKLAIAETMAPAIMQVGQILAASLKQGGKALFCGNGGSAADSQHLATELVVRLSSENNRQALGAIALTTDSSILTACANDYGFDYIFSRQVEALGRSGDILFAISTSGNSQNVINAVNAAKKLGITTVGFLGASGGKLAGLVDYPLIVPSNDVQHIQESHITIGHIIIGIAESDFINDRS